MPLYPVLLATISALIQVFHVVSKVAAVLRYPIISLFVSVAAFFMVEIDWERPATAVPARVFSRRGYSDNSLRSRLRKLVSHFHGSTR
jgi:hypothetical protein